MNSIIVMMSSRFFNWHDKTQPLNTPTDGDIRWDWVGSRTRLAGVGLVRNLHRPDLTILIRCSLRDLCQFVCVRFWVIFQYQHHVTNTQIPNVASAFHLRSIIKAGLTTSIHLAQNEEIILFRVEIWGEPEYFAQFPGLSEEWRPRMRLLGVKTSRQSPTSPIIPNGRELIRSATW